jgi:hypothetical protein
LNDEPRRPNAQRADAIGGAAVVGGSTEIGRDFVAEGGIGSSSTLVAVFVE